MPVRSVIILISCGSELQKLGLVSVKVLSPAFVSLSISANSLMVLEVYNCCKGKGSLLLAGALNNRV